MTTDVYNHQPRNAHFDNWENIETTYDVGINTPQEANDYMARRRNGNVVLCETCLMPKGPDTLLAGLCCECFLDQKQTHEPYQD